MSPKKNIFFPLSLSLSLSLSPHTHSLTTQAACADSSMVRIRAFQARGPGSIPGRRSVTKKERERKKKYSPPLPWAYGVIGYHFGL